MIYGDLITQEPEPDRDGVILGHESLVRTLWREYEGQIADWFGFRIVGELPKTRFFNDKGQGVWWESPQELSFTKRGLRLTTPIKESAEQMCIGGASITIGNLSLTKYYASRADIFTAGYFRNRAAEIVMWWADLFAPFWLYQECRGLSNLLIHKCPVPMFTGDTLRHTWEIEFR